VRETDVVVVGLGAAGCAAAIEAHDAGAEVVVLEKMPESYAGGNTRVSGSLWFHNEDPERAARYLRSLCGPYDVPDAIVRTWARETARNTEWIEGLGASVGLMYRAPEFPELDGSDSYGGCLHVMPSWGMGRLFDTLSEAVAARSVEVRFESPATGLIRVSGDGSIDGVEVGGDSSRSIRARKGVVLATGGFQNNPRMVRDYLGLPGAAPVGSPANTGDGIRLAQSVGADLWHMSNCLPFIAIRPRDLSSAVPVKFSHSTGYIYVGLDGERFADESAKVRHGRTLKGGVYRLFPDQPMHIIFDEKTRQAGRLALTLEEAPFYWASLVEGYAWSQNNLTEIERGWITQADTLEDLAAALGSNSEVFCKTVGEYNKSCVEGQDRHFGRDASTMVPIDTPPYFACTWGPALITTCGGPRRNEVGQVLDTCGQVIPRLYCAGDISSTYSYCMDGGMLIADALAFGRIAGRAVAGLPDAGPDQE
jgi:succinate dehydrogenase/fumarate reductase flavoprotein subunit